MLPTRVPAPVSSVRVPRARAEQASGRLIHCPLWHTHRFCRRPPLRSEFIRAVHRAALHALAPAHALHFGDLAHLDHRHRARDDGAHHGALGLQRFPARSAHAHVGAVAHAQIQGLGDTLPNWRELMQRASQTSRGGRDRAVRRFAGVATSGATVRGAFLRGIVPELEDRSTTSERTCGKARLDVLKPGEFNIVLGEPLARTLGVTPGERIVLVAPQGQVTCRCDPAAAAVHRRGHFSVGHYEIDSTLALSISKMPSGCTCSAIG